MRSTRKAAAVVALGALVALAAGCGDDAPEIPAPQSGKPPLPASTTTTTTEPESPPDTVVPQVVEVPAWDDLGLSWDEAPVVDEATGEANMAAFNEYLVTDAPNAMMPEGTFDVLADPDATEEELDAADAALDEALEIAPRKAAALFLGVQPSDVDVQMLAGDTGGPEGARIVVVLDNLQDDSIAAVRWEFTIQMQDRAGFVAAEDETAQAEEGQGGQATEEETGGAETQTEADGSTVEEEDAQAAPAVKDFIPVVYSAVRTLQCQPDRGHVDFTPEPCV